MQNEVDAEVLHSMLQYYKSKSSQLEYEFLSYKLLAEKQISFLKSKNETVSPGSEE